MPGISGLTVLDTLVAQGVDQPVIMLTGHGTVEMCRRAFKAGAAEFLEKPVDDEQLLEALQQRGAPARAARASASQADQRGARALRAAVRARARGAGLDRRRADQQGDRRARWRCRRARSRRTAPTCSPSSRRLAGAADPALCGAGRRGRGGSVVLRSAGRSRTNGARGAAFSTVPHGRRTAGTQPHTWRTPMHSHPSPRRPRRLARRSPPLGASAPGRAHREEHVARTRQPDRRRQRRRLRRQRLRRGRHRGRPRRHRARRAARRQRRPAHAGLERAQGLDLGIGQERRRWP